MSMPALEGKLLSTPCSCPAGRSKGTQLRRPSKNAEVRCEASSGTGGPPSAAAQAAALLDDLGSPKAN